MQMAQYTPCSICIFVPDSNPIPHPKHNLRCVAPFALRRLQIGPSPEKTEKCKPMMQAVIIVSFHDCRPMKTSRPMPYSIGGVLGTVCLDGYCLINNVFVLFIYSYSVPRKRLAMLFLKVSKLQNKYAVWPRKKVSRYYCNN